jgi:invasion protein IalB
MNRACRSGDGFAFPATSRAIHGAPRLTLANRVARPKVDACNKKESSVIANASPIRAAQRSRRGTATRIVTGAAALIASLAIVGEAQAQQQTQQNQQQQNQQQFGPRANQTPRQQPQQPQMPKPELVATHGDWAVQCQQEPGAEGGAAVRTCGMFQAAKSDRQGVGLTLVVVKGEQDGKEVTMLRVMAPIGVYLPTGVALEIDGDAVGRVPFTRCMPQACIAVAEASPPTLEKMKSGGVANFIIYEAPGAGMAMELSLKGFTAALGELNNL